MNNELLIIEKIDDLAGRIGQLDERLSGRIDQLDDRLSGSIGQLDERLSGRIGQLDERLSGRIGQLDEHLGGMDEREDTLFSQLSDLTSYVQNEVATKQELVDMESRMMTGIDAFARKTEKNELEILAITNRIDRLHGKASV